MAIRITLGLWHARIERVDNEKPDMRRQLLDMAKNDLEFKRQIANGQRSEKERKMFGGT